GRDGVPAHRARRGVQPPRGATPHRTHAPDPRTPCAPGPSDPGRRQVRRLRAEPPRAQARPQAHVPPCGLAGPRASDHRRAVVARGNAARGARAIPGPAPDARGEGRGVSRQLVIFDWDGTLMDSTRLIASCLQCACHDLGLNVPEFADAKYVIGLGLSDTVRYVAPSLNEARARQLVERYRHHFLAREHEAQLYSGVDEMLADLHGRGVRMAVAT